MGDLWDKKRAPLAGTGSASKAGGPPGVQEVPGEENKGGMSATGVLSTAELAEDKRKFALTANARAVTRSSASVGNWAEKHKGNAVPASATLGVGGLPMVPEGCDEEAVGKLPPKKGLLALGPKIVKPVPQRSHSQVSVSVTQMPGHAIEE
jgi:hypothetical protein